MRLRVVREIIPDVSPTVVYELGDYGVLIQLAPKQEHWVKECREGRIVEKKKCGNAPYRVDAAGRWFYLLKGVEPPLEEDMIPSIWKEGVDYEQKNEI